MTAYIDVGSAEATIDDSIDDIGDTNVGVVESPESAEIRWPDMVPVAPFLRRPLVR
jgi:hypothetical protein